MAARTSMASEPWPVTQGIWMDEYVFRYRPLCSTEGCSEPVVYKVAACWSDGTSREMKNYGLACEIHRDAQLERGRLHRQELALGEGETLGPAELYRLVPGQLDSVLPLLPDQPD